MAEKLRAILSGVGGMTASLSGEQTLSVDITIPKAVAVEEYAGPYEYTPSAEEQVVEISGKRATQNITVGAIPQNYGLITWDGTTITVS